MECINKSEQEAADWLARRDSASWGASDQASFEAWLNASGINRVEFLRMEHVWEESQRLKALGAGIRLHRTPPPGRWVFSALLSPRVRSGNGVNALRSSTGLRACAVAAVVLVAVGLYVNRIGFGEPGRYSTPVGKVTQIPMTDGSHVTLNTDSRIRVSVTATTRAVELQRGEAFFEVAKDPLRPFIVKAGNQRIIAVGTRFSVRRDGNEAEVIVTEGRVRVETEGAGPSALPVSLPAGSVAHATQSGTLVMSEPVAQAEELLSWRSGVLVFHDSTLAEAAAEFNRYTTRKIVIRNSNVAEMRVSGTFKATNAEAFVRLLEHGYPIRSEVLGEEIVLESH